MPAPARVGVATVRGRKEPLPVYSVDVIAQTTGRHRTGLKSSSLRVQPTERPPEEE